MLPGYIDATEEGKRMSRWDRQAEGAAVKAPKKRAQASNSPDLVELGVEPGSKKARIGEGNRVSEAQGHKTPFSSFPGDGKMIAVGLEIRANGDQSPPDLTTAGDGSPPPKNGLIRGLNNGAFHSSPKPIHSWMSEYVATLLVDCDASGERVLEWEPLWSQWARLEDKSKWEKMAEMEADRHLNLKKTQQKGQSKGKITTPLPAPSAPIRAPAQWLSSVGPQCLTSGDVGVAGSQWGRAIFPLLKAHADEMGELESLIRSCESSLILHIYKRGRDKGTGVVFFDSGEESDAIKLYEKGPKVPMKVPKEGQRLFHLFNSACTLVRLGRGVIDAANAVCAIAATKRRGRVDVKVHAAKKPLQPAAAPSPDQPASVAPNTPTIETHPTIPVFDHAPSEQEVVYPTLTDGGEVESAMPVLQRAIEPSPTTSTEGVGGTNAPSPPPKSPPTEPSPSRLQAQEELASVVEPPHPVVKITFIETNRLRLPRKPDPPPTVDPVSALDALEASENGIPEPIQPMQQQETGAVEFPEVEKAVKSIDPAQKELEGDQRLVADSRINKEQLAIHSDRDQATRTSRRRVRKTIDQQRGEVIDLDSAYTADYGGNPTDLAQHLQFNTHVEEERRDAPKTPPTTPVGLFRRPEFGPPSQPRRSDIASSAFTEGIGAIAFELGPCRNFIPPSNNDLASSAFTTGVLEVNEEKSDSKYQIYERGVLGDGQFGKVYLARNRATGRKVAAKLVEISDKTNSEQEAMRHEAYMLGRIGKHPGIVGFYELVVKSNLMYLVLEKMRSDLLNMINKLDKERFSERAVKLIVYQLLSAIRYLHELDIVHCDLKPENILVATKSARVEDYLVVKICDFGYAKVIRPGKKMPARDCGGTLPYMAPELFYPRQKYDRAVDVWATGVITHITLFNVFPFYYSEKVGNDEEKKKRQLRKSFKAYEMNADAIFKDVRNLASAQAISFIAHLLDMNQKTRPAVDTVLLHEWLRGDQLRTDVEQLEAKRRARERV